MGNEKGKRPARLALIGREPDVAFYLEAARGRRGPILVLGCADGRIALELAEAGYDLIGVDPSGLMIELAESRKAAASEAAKGRVRFLSADLRSLRLNESFSLILAPQNALGLMASHEDLEAFWASVRHHLQPGGALLFDVATPPAPTLKPIHGHDSKDPDSPLEPLEPERPLFAPHLRERRREKGQREGGIRRLRLRHFSPDEVDESLEASGFLALERFGGFDGRPYDERSDRQVVHAVLDTRPSVRRDLASRPTDGQGE